MTAARISKSSRPIRASCRNTCNLKTPKTPRSRHESRRRVSDQRLRADGSGGGDAGVWRRVDLPLRPDGAPVVAGTDVQRTPAPLGAPGAGDKAAGAGGPGHGSLRGLG